MAIFFNSRYYGGDNATKVNDRSKPLPYPSLYLGGRPDGYVLKGGDATKGTLDTMYGGPRPDCAIAGTCNRHQIQNAKAARSTDEQEGCDHTRNRWGLLEQRHGNLLPGNHGERRDNGRDRPVEWTVHIRQPARSRYPHSTVCITSLVPRPPIALSHPTANLPTSCSGTRDSHKPGSAS